MISLNSFKNILRKNSINYCRLISTSNLLSNIDNNNTINSNENDLLVENSLDISQYKSLAIDKKTEAKIKIVLNEYQLYKLSDEYKDRVPTKLSINDMKQLLDCHQTECRRRVWRDLSPDKRRHLLYLMKSLEESDGKNQLTTRLLPLEFEKLYTNRLKNAALFGQNIVFDISFDSHMSALECKNLAEQLNRIYKFNKYKTANYSSNELPFNLNLCNVDNNHKSIKFMNFLFPDMVSDKSFINITSKSYLDLFPKSELIYLSPHAEHVLTEFDHNSVFIIGGIVDRKKVISLSYPKAMAENIRSMRLPIDALIAKSNIQSLDSVFKVIFDFKVFGINNESNNEKIIRKHLPKYKLKSVDQITIEMLKRNEIIDNFEYFDEESEKNADIN